MKLSILVLIGALAAGPAWAAQEYVAALGLDNTIPPVPWIPIPF